MKELLLNNFKNGWIVGDFNPNIINWGEGEIAIKEYKKGFVEIGYCHEAADVFLILVSGVIRCSGKTIYADTILQFGRGESISFVAIEDSKAIIIVYGDKTFSRKPLNSIDDYLEIYGGLINFNTCKSFPFEDLSVVVQGGIDRTLTPICMASIRKFLPGSRIILSTWEGMPTDNIDYDELVISQDPKGVTNYHFEDFDYEYINNVNRQLVSTQKGLEVVKTKYVLKLRTDMVLLSNGILNYLGKYEKSNDEYRIFMSKVIIADIWTRHYIEIFDKYVPAPFHPSDWFQLGYTEDLKRFYLGTPLMPVEDAGAYRNLKHYERKRQYKYGWNCRWVPEQYFAIKALERSGYTIDYDDWSDWDENNMNQSIKFIMNNYIVLNFEQTGILLPKYSHIITANSGVNGYSIKGLFTNSAFEKLYGNMFENQNLDNIWDTNLEYDTFTQEK